MYRHGRSLFSLCASRSGAQTSLSRRSLSDFNKKEANFTQHSLVRLYGGELATPGSDVSVGASQQAKNFSNKSGGLEHLNSALLCSKNAMCGMSAGSMKLKGKSLAPYSLNFQNFFSSSNQRGFDDGSYAKSMNFVRGAIAEDETDRFGGHRLPQYHDAEQNADIVHIKIGRNNTFVTVTDSKGNKKCGASSGSLPGSRGGRYSADAAAEHVGRLSRNLGLKSVVMRVNGFTFFKKKKQAIMSWRDGFTQSRVGELSPIICIEDTTRKAHNGCRLPKRRRT